MHSRVQFLTIILTGIITSFAPSIPPQNPAQTCKEKIGVKNIFSQIFRAEKARISAVRDKNRM